MRPTVIVVLGLLGLQLVWPTPLGILAWGMVVSATSALLALGLAVVYRSHRVVNFAQADMGMVPASLAMSLVVLHGWTYWAAVPLALVVGAALGALIEVVVVRRFARSPRLILMVATIGVAQILAGIAEATPTFLGAALAPQSIPAPFDFQFEIAPMIFHANELLALVATVVCLGGLFVVLRRTDFGIALRASAESASRTALLGVPVPRVQCGAWAMTGILSTVALLVRAGTLGLPLGAALGPSVLIRALAAAVIGRMEHLPTIVLASFGIGIVETAIIWNEGSAELVDPALFVIVVVALLLQRRGTSSSTGDDPSEWDDAIREHPVPDVLARLPEVRWARRAVVLLVGVAVLAVPALTEDRWTNLAAAMLIYAIVAVSLVVLTGWAGEISLGQVAFVAIGGAAVGTVNVHLSLGTVPSLLLAGVVGAAASVVIGLPALRIRGIFLGVTTLTFAVATGSMLADRDRASFLPTLLERVTRRPLATPFGDVSIASETAMYVTCAVGLFLVVVAVRGLQRSHVEREIVAGRDNPRAAQALGRSVARAQLLAFAISGFIAAFAGGLLALHQQALGQQIYAPVESLRVLTMVVVGGLTSIPGAVLGAVFLQGTLWFSSWIPEQFRFLFTFAGSGIGLLVILWFVPGGFGGVILRVRDAWLRRVVRRRSLEMPDALRTRAARAADDAAEAAATRPETAPIPRSGHQDATPRTDVAIALRAVDAGYGRTPVVRDITVSVRRGEAIALLGTNGAGKSTILGAISGIVAPSAGRVWIDGIDVTHVAAHRRSSLGVAHVPGGRSVFAGLTISENLRLAAWGSRHDRATTAARRARALTLIPSLADRLDERADQLSGGQQRLLGLAMALVTAPRIVLLDELSLGLSPLVLAQVLDVVRALRAEGVTIVLVEQSVTSALRLADRALFIEKGVVRFHGLTAELLDRPDLVRSIFLDGATATFATTTTDPDPDRVVGVGRAVERDPEVTAQGHGSTTADVTVTSPTPALEVRGLTKHFAGIAAVDGVDLVVAAGEIVALIGPNGAGKTTVFDVVSGFRRADGGRVLLDGHDVTDEPAARRAARGLGRSFQDARLFGTLTVAQTVALALDRPLRTSDSVAGSLRLPSVRRRARDVDQRADALLDAMGLTPLRDRFVADLSTGSRRIVDLACLVARGPSVVLLDEPSAGIAQRETDALVPLLRALRDERGAALVIIEHDLGLVGAVAERVVALDLGRVLATGTPHEVLHDPAVIAAHLGDDPLAIGHPTG